MISIEKNLKKIFSVIFQINEKNIKLSSGFKNIKKWDSLNHVKLIMAIESKFNISIDPEESLQLVSFGQILKYLKKKHNI
jgi:acyl carrier protein